MRIILIVVIIIVSISMSEISGQPVDHQIDQIKYLNEKDNSLSVSANFFNSPVYIANSSSGTTYMPISWDASLGGILYTQSFYSNNVGGTDVFLKSPNSSSSLVKSTPYEPILTMSVEGKYIVSTWNTKQTSSSSTVGSQNTLQILNSTTMDPISHCNFAGAPGQFSVSHTYIFDASGQNLFVSDLNLSYYYYHICAGAGGKIENYSLSNLTVHGIASNSSSALFSGSLKESSDKSVNQIIEMNSGGIVGWNNISENGTNLHYVPQCKLFVGNFGGTLSLFNSSGIIKIYKGGMKNEIGASWLDGYEWFANGSSMIQGINLSSGAMINETEPSPVGKIISHSSYLFLSGPNCVLINIPQNSSFLKMDVSGLPSCSSSSLKIVNDSNGNVSFLTPNNNSFYVSGFFLYPKGDYRVSVLTQDPRFISNVQNLAVNLSNELVLSSSFKMLSIYAAASLANQTSSFLPAPTSGNFALAAYSLHGVRYYEWEAPASNPRFDSSFSMGTWYFSFPSGSQYIEIQGQSGWIDPRVSGNLILSQISDPSLALGNAPSFSLTWLIPDPSTSSTSHPGSSQNNSATGIWKLLGFSIDPPAASIKGIGAFFQDAAYFWSGVGGRAIYGMIMFLAAFYYLLRINEHYSGKKPRSRHYAKRRQPS